MFTPAEILEMVKSGVSVDDIERLAAVSSRVEAPASSTDGAPKAKASTPDWLVARGERKAARRALAATLRASGVDLSTDAGRKAWAEAKAKAGLTKAEKAAHKAYVASKKA